MTADLDPYDYIISIDLGSTFSGSCYTCIRNKDTIVHVTKWPHQETFEKTPSVCLYDIAQHPPVMIKWGQAAVDHAALYPNDANTLLISEFKLKLFNLNAAATIDSVVSYRTAAVDYLRAIHTYTLQQFLQNNPTANEARVRYVLTIPATWVNQDSENLRQIAMEANVISASEPEATQKARLAVLSEAHAASLFCEREYCATSVTQLSNAQRYLVIDVGGATADLATYECTENEQGHCQLALESMGVCGSIILDQHMETYLKDQVFFGCADERLIKLLVEQFKTKIKHYFGEDGNEHNNHVPPAVEQAVELSTADDAHLMAVMETKVPVDMTDFQQDDYDYDAFNDSYHSDDFMDEGDDAFDSGNHADNYEDVCSDFEGVHETDQQSDDEMDEDYIYLSMPPNFKALIEPLIIENLLLRRDLTTSNQIRISHAEIAKHVFDPVVDKVISLIRKQIRKSCTTIDTLFLLGGFGQSPYLQKKLHEEFITSTNSVQRMIVPENGYRASMRGGIHYGLDCAKAIPETYIKDKSGNTYRDKLLYSKYDTLVAIDFNFDEMTAMYSIIQLNGNGRLDRSEVNLLIKNKLEWHASSDGSSDGAIFNNYDSIIYKFHFDPSTFMEEYYSSLEDVLSFNQSTLLSNSDAESAFQQQKIDHRIYFDFFINGFMQQLFVHILTRNINQFSTRYCASISSTTTPSGLHVDNDTPQETLKRHLLSKMMQSTRLPNALKCPLHDAVCDILDDYAPELSHQQSWLLLPLRKKIRQVGIYLDMLEESDSEARFTLNLHTKNTYYIRKCSQENAIRYEASKVFVFDLMFAGLASLHRSRRREAYLSTHPRVNVPATETQQRGRVQVCSMERGHVLLHNEETFFQNLDFVGILNQEPETVLTSAVEILELVAARNFLVHHLLAFLGTETDFMSSKHVRDYIKKHVDLSEPDKVHRIGNVFLKPNTDNVVSLEYQQASILMKNAIDHTIRRFKDKTFSTKQIRELLLLPWIRRVLVPVVIKAHSDAYKRSETLIQHSTAVRKRVSYLVFPEQIIETKYQGQRQMFQGSNRQTCAAYLFDALQQEIDPLILRGSLPSDIEMHAKTTDDKIYGHLGCIIDAVRMPRKQETSRIARRTYAVHFLKYFVQRPNKALAAAQDQSDQEGQEVEAGDASNKQDNEADKKKTPIVEINIDFQDHLRLYPLIQQDANLTNALDNNWYCIQDKCSLAAVLYVSDEMPPSSEYYISNTSFKKLHRFIIPIEDPSQLIHIQCAPEDYSILFTVSQGDDYNADFRCNDLMYYC